MAEHIIRLEDKDKKIQSTTATKLTI